MTTEAPRAAGRSTERARGTGPEGRSAVEGPPSPAGGAPPPAAPGPTLVELKLLTSAALALVYAGALWGVARPPRTPASRAPVRGAASRPADLAVPEPRWLEQLPPLARPAVIAPPGWEVSSLSLAVAVPDVAAPSQPGSRVSRVATPRRFRTRSS